MEIMRDSHSERAVEQALQFGSQIVGASSACLVWLEDNFEFSIADEYNMPTDFLARYPKELRGIDPLNTLALTMRGARTEMLYHDEIRASDSWTEYVSSIEQYNFGDEMDMLLWSAGRPIAGLAMFRPPRASPFQNEHLNWDGIHAGSVANMGHGRAASPSWGIRQHWRNAY